MEYIYPTEYEPGDILPAATGKGGATGPATPAPDAPATTPATPTAFETRNTGTTLEASLKPVEVEDHTWDLLYELETVMPTGFTELGAPELHIKMPTFNVSGLMRLTEGEWQLAARAAGNEKRVRWQELGDADPDRPGAVGWGTEFPP